MFKSRKFYPCLALISAIICLILLSNCGGGGNSTIVPSSGITSTPNSATYTDVTPTPVLTSKPVSGYIYGNNITTDEGETVPRINVLDVPACQADSSGNEPFVTQVSNSLQQDYPEDWANSNIQELYTQLNKTLSESKPLPEYNAQAQVSSAYDDASIPVGSDGHFDNTVLTGASDSNVKLEVALGEDNYAEVETLPSSGSINSSDATSAAVLKSCPEKIFAFPGEILIFKVYAEPGINLKSAGLKFKLNNASIGCITQPVYLCLFGSHKYQVAYGCVYIKHGLDTPVDTTITAKLNSGQSMSIFLEVIKKTASISGAVYTGGVPLVKGYVKSLGPKACCKIDASGNYTLPKVFRGHSRSVIATWWTSENGKKVKHREEKIIDFFNQDVTGFNFGVPPTPTPTSTPTSTPTPRDPWDPFYTKMSGRIMSQKQEWIKMFGVQQGVQKTVDWVNGNLDIALRPSAEIEKALVDPDDPTVMWIKFKDGKCVALLSQPFTDAVGGTDTANFKTYLNMQEKKDVVKQSFPSGNTIRRDITVNSNRILIYSVFEWQFPKIGNVSVESDIADMLPAPDYAVTKKIVTDDQVKKYLEGPNDGNVILTTRVITDQTMNNNNVINLNLSENKQRFLRSLRDSNVQFSDQQDFFNTINELYNLPGSADPFLINELATIWNATIEHPYYRVVCTIKDGQEKNIIKPDDFINLGQYGVIYIFTHGFTTGIACGPVYYNPNDTTRPCEYIVTWA